MKQGSCTGMSSPPISCCCPAAWSSCWTLGSRGTATMPRSPARARLSGRPPYMSPEQVVGQKGTAASDIWALGVLLYEMLAGRPPFSGDTIPSVLYQVTHATPPPVPGLSVALNKVLRRGLAKDPARRYPNASSLALALREARLSGSAPQQTSVHGLRLPRGRGLVLAVAALALAGVGLGMMARFLRTAPLQARAGHPAAISAVIPAYAPAPSRAPPQDTAEGAARETPGQTRDAASAPAGAACPGRKASARQSPGKAPSGACFTQAAGGSACRTSPNQASHGVWAPFAAAPTCCVSAARAPGLRPRRDRTIGTLYLGRGALAPGLFHRTQGERREHALPAVCFAQHRRSLFGSTAGKTNTFDETTAILRRTLSWLI